MGASSSRLEEDKGLQLCRARKKFIKQALYGRCSLAAAHIAYVDELKIIGAALRRFVDPDAQVDAFVYPSRGATPEPHAFIEKYAARLSSSSQSQSQHADMAANLLPSPSSRASSQFQAHPMQVTGTVSTKIEEKPSVPVVISVSSTTPPSTTPRSGEASEFSTSNIPLDNPPWDYFGLFHPVENDYSADGRRMFDQGSDCSDEIRHLREEEGIPDLEDIHESSSECQESEEEFDEPSSASLVRRFRNVNSTTKGVSGDGSPISKVPEAKYSSLDNVSEPVVNAAKGDSPIKHPDSVESDTNFADGKKIHASDASPLSNDVKTTAEEGSRLEDRVVPKDFISSITDIEQLFFEASESGKEVPRMLEANKFHFRPVFPGRERRLAAASLLKSCFSCGEDPSEVQQEPPQHSVKYLTWHRTSSFRSPSSRNLLATNSTNDTADPSKILFDNFFMVSGSHASTLDRLFAWEKKLYDEVKASEVLRSSFDQKCKLLRQKESRGENTEKLRATVKDLHSRITVAVHRINSISKKIEEIRDTELQPQLEELIEGLRRMWETMVECHKLQFHIISVSHAPASTKQRMQSDSQRQITIHLGYSLSSLSSTFTKWITAQKIYVESIEKWLFKCVSLTQKQPSKRNRRMRPPSMRHCGPPIYMICGAWLEMIEALPSKGVMDSIKELAAEVAQFLPRQDKKQDRVGDAGTKGDEAITQMLRDDVVPRMDRVRTSLAGFLAKLHGFAECSLRMFSELQKATQDAKKNYEQFKSQRAQVLV